MTTIANAAAMISATACDLASFKVSPRNRDLSESKAAVKVSLRSNRRTS
jgi:hypothetical protein